MMCQRKKTKFTSSMMGRYNTAKFLLSLALCVEYATPFLSQRLSFLNNSILRNNKHVVSSSSICMNAINNYNAVHVEKKGGRGATSASDDAVKKNLSLGAPGDRPQGGHFLTRGGIQITAQVDRLQFINSKSDVNAPAGSSSKALGDLIDDLDSRRGVLLCSSYEFPGRYARWSLGFSNPPLEVSGKSQDCTIRALNERGTVILPAVARTMEKLLVDGTLESVDVVEDRVQVRVSPPAEVGTFSEEDRSRQVSGF